MPTPDVTAGEVMDSAAALLNDTQKQVYTYVAQLPYLKVAMKELREAMELSNLPVTNETSAVIAVPDGTTEIGFSTIPALPSDLVEIQRLWERSSGSNPFVPMTKREFLPKYLDGEETSSFIIWAWSDNKIKVLAANRDNDIKIDYIQQLFVLSTLDQNTAIGVINGDSFLHYRTAALCSEFIGENKTRADSLNIQAELAKDRLTGIENKAKQAISTRRRPFRSGWKSRGTY